MPTLMRPIRLDQAHLAEIAGQGIPVPGYDRAVLEPRIVHIGVGGFHRAHLALYAHELASRGSTWGIVGLGLLPHDAAMAEALRSQDFLYTLIERGAGEPSAQVIGTIIGFVHAPEGHDAAVAELIAAPSTSILSLTITESGYEQPAAGGPRTTFDRIAGALAERRERGSGPLTIVSCDNLPGNGTAARRATLAAAQQVDPGLRDWVLENCTFPNSMVDRITPVTSDADRGWLREQVGVEDAWPVVAEPFRQWVMEDAFAAERPPFEDVGVLYTDRIEDWEQYKLRMLNAAHSAMAYLCALSGITFVHEAMAEPAVRPFLEDLLHREAIPTLAEIPGHPAADYAAAVLTRFANPGVRDQIARLCIDGSAKFPKFLIPSIVRQLDAGGPVERAATALAGWARYLAVVAQGDQAFDADGDAARRHATAALEDPVAFLEFGAVFPERLRTSARFRGAFTDGYRRIAGDGAIAAMREQAQVRR
jgi:mannitol 2-dehydrogenase